MTQQPTWTTEASTLGFAPGEWPKTIEWMEAEFEDRYVAVSPDGDVLWVDYVETVSTGNPLMPRRFADGGHTLRVWND